MRTAVRMTYVVSEDEVGSRLDKWLTERLQDDDVDISRNVVQLWIKDGRVTAEGIRKIKASDVIEGDRVYQVEVPPESSFEIEPDSMELDIAFEDEDLIVINKPRGVVVHPGAGHWRETLVNALVARGTALSGLGGEMRPGVVHRIDKDTSGLLMFAKTDKAYYVLSEQLREHSVERRYVGIVHGRMGHLSGTIDMPIGRDPQDRQRMAALEKGKRAVTHFHVKERFERYSVVECQLETGRTHQIRVHMAAITHPLAGDSVYGRRHTLPIAGQALHAETLGFVHPRSGEEMRFTCALPDDMQSLIDHLQSGRLE